MKFKNSPSKQGLTLIEALIWFALFAAVVAGVFGLYSNSRNANNAATVNKELSTIYSKTESLFSQESTTGLNNEIGLKLGIYPKSVKVKGNVVNNVFGGTINLTGAYPSSFTVEYTSFPTGETCSNIIKSQKAIGWYLVNVGGSVIMYDTDYSLSKVAEACGSNGGKTRIVSFVKV